VLIAGVAHCYKIDPENLKSDSKKRAVIEARRVVSYIAVRKLGYKCTEVSKAMGVSAVTVSKAVSLGSELPEVDKIQTQILESWFRIIAVQRNQTGKIEKWNGRPSHSPNFFVNKPLTPGSACSI